MNADKFERQERFVMWFFVSIIVCLFVWAAWLNPTITIEPGSGPEELLALPKASTNLKSWDNHWYTFDLEIAGRKRTFLARGRFGQPGSVLTELYEEKR